MTTVKVLLFSVLRDRLGDEDLTVSVGASITGGQLLDRLAQEYSPINNFRSVIRLAVNEAYVSEEHILKDGDEVALITPVSGG